MYDIVNGRMCYSELRHLFSTHRFRYDTATAMPVSAFVLVNNCPL